MVPCYLLDLLIYSVPLLLAFLLALSAVMIWLNLRGLRSATQRELKALRESVDRLAGTSPQEAPAGGSGAASEPAPDASPAEPAAPESIWFSCPECGKFFEGKATLSGSTYKCPECHVDFHIH
jgi:hypothetical protein